MIEWITTLNSTHWVSRTRFAKNRQFWGILSTIIKAHDIVDQFRVLILLWRGFLPSYLRLSRFYLGQEF